MRLFSPKRYRFTILNAFGVSPAATMAGGHGVAPSYVNLESTRSSIDPPPADAP